MASSNDAGSPFKMPSSSSTSSDTPPISTPTSPLMEFLKDTDNDRKGKRKMDDYTGVLYTTPRSSPLVDYLNSNDKERKGKQKEVDDSVQADLYTPPRVFGTAPVTMVERRNSSNSFMPRSYPMRPRRLFRLIDEEHDGGGASSSELNTRGGGCKAEALFSKHFFATNETHASPPPLQNTDVNASLAEMSEQLTLIARKVDSIHECPCQDCHCCKLTSPARLNGPNVARHPHSPRPESVAELIREGFQIQINGLEPRYPPVNPFNGDILRQIIEFQDWYFGEPYNNRLTLSIPGRGQGVGRGWFTPLLFKNQLLDDQIMNALVYLIASQNARDHGQWDNSWTFVPVMTWEGLINPDIDIARGLAQPYIDGVQPLGHSIPWIEADRVFGVGNIGGNHWILYELEVQRRRIVVYDPMSLHMPWPMMHAQFQQMAWNLPLLLEEGLNGVGNGRGWEVLRAAHPPQQVNAFDCGIMVIEYFNALVTGQGLATVQPNRSSDDRLRYCGLLYRYAMEYLRRHRM